MKSENWLGHAVYLYGDSGSGKSHLAYIWQAQNNATAISINDINPENVSGNCTIEDIENCRNERLLLHLFNHCRDIGVKLLITSRLPPSSLPFTLPDLTSRLRACQQATIKQPDDIIISAVLRKQFADRQLIVDEDVISYIVTRLERSLKNTSNLVEKLDKAALEQHRKITIPLIRELHTIF